MRSFLPLLLLILLASCSSAEKEMKEAAPIPKDTPQEVICQGKPSNCEYEIQNICQEPDKYELIGKPIPSFFSTTVTYKVRYRCIKAQ